MTAPSTLECILRLVLSALLGGVVGLEREFRLKEAGIRTHLIVSFASCMMMLASKYGFYDVLEHSSVSLDPSRIAAGLVTAIGFLGAGTIFARRRGVTGLTTAAGLWATVGIGMTAGAGMYLISAIGTGFIVASQAALHRDHDLKGRAAGTILIQAEDGPDAPGRLEQALAGLGLTLSGARYERAGGVLSLELEMDRLPCPRQELGTLLLPLMEQPYIKSVRW